MEKGEKKWKNIIYKKTRTKEELKKNRFTAT